MKPFVYKVRTAREQIVREVQTATEVDKSPRAEPEAICQRCRHPRWAHCNVRRTKETRDVLFYARHHGGQYAWQRAHSYNRLLSGYSAVRCKHAAPDGAVDFPCCSTASCAVRDCLCQNFLSPYRKPRKKATPTEGTCTRKKRKKTTAQAELFSGV